MTHFHTQITLATIAVAVLCLIAPVAAATTYYVDAAAGDDLNNGQSTATAWKTLAKVSSTALLPGDTVLLKRDSVFYGQLMLTASGTAEAPIVIGAYGTGAAPLLNGAYEVEWTQLDATRYEVVLDTQPELVAVNDMKMLPVDAAEGFNNTDVWFWDGVTLTIITTREPVTIEVATRSFAIGMNASEHVIVRDLEVTHAVYPVYLYNTNNVTVENMDVHDSVGTAGITVDGNIEGRGWYNVIRNCRVSNITGNSMALQYENDGNGIQVYGAECFYNTVEGNTVANSGYEGLVIGHGSFNTVTRNTVYGSAHAGIRVGTETATGNIVEYNHVYGNCTKKDDRFGIDLIRCGNDNVVRYNLVHDQHVLDESEGGNYGSGGIRFDGGDWMDLDVMDSTGNKAYYNLVYNEYVGLVSFNFSNVEFYNNTVVNSGAFGAVIQSTLASDGVNNVIVNNIFDTAGTALIYHYRINDTLYDNNVYFQRDGQANFILREGDTYNNLSFTAWQDRTGQDLHSVYADPGFIDIESLNLSLGSLSPAIDMGMDVGLSKDYKGDDVAQGNGVDAGAMEYVPVETPEATPLTVVINTSLTTYSKNRFCYATITFSEPVADFTADDLTIENGGVNKFSGSGTTYNVRLRADIGAQQVSLSVLADAAHSILNQGNEAATPMLWTLQ